MPIYFYSTKEQPYGCFSNFAAYPFELDGATWPTSEHYFQAQKFVDTPHVEAVQQATGPMVAARMGRDSSRPLRPDWEQVKDDVMRRAVLRKFETHADIPRRPAGHRRRSAGRADDRDYYWGIGTDGTGQNRLGQILMEVRAILRAREQEAS